VAYLFIQRFGRSALTLGYSMAGANLVMAPFVPPIRRAGRHRLPHCAQPGGRFSAPTGTHRQPLADLSDSERVHTNYAVSAMFLTAMAAMR